MSERIKWIEHQGKKILFSDYSGLKGEEFTKAIQEGEAETLKSGSKVVLILSDVTDSTMNKESIAALEHRSQACKDNGITQHLALIGISPMQKALAKLIRRDAYFAKDLADAKDWLVKQ